MEIWLDTVDSPLIKIAKEWGVLFGITTNPSIVADAQRPLKALIEELLTLQEGPVAVQVMANIKEDMVKQAFQFHQMSPRIIVKIPATSEGLKALVELAANGISTMATTIVEPLQGLFAAKAGATYLAPYLSYMGDEGIDNLKHLQKALTHYQLPTKLLVASLRTKKHILECALAGFAAVTIKSNLFQESFQTPRTSLECLEKFEKRWGEITF